VANNRATVIYDAEDKTKGAANQLVRDLGLTFSSAFEDAIAEGRTLSVMLKDLEIAARSIRG
jgi:hypothetical protein